MGWKIYVICGITSHPDPGWATYRYDPSGNEWTALSAMPGKPRLALSAAALNGKIYVFGGKILDGNGDVSARIDEYDPATDTWAVMAKGQMDVGRYNHKAVTVGSKILVLGGNNGQKTLSTGGEYDPQKNTWDSYMMSMPREMEWGYIEVYWFGAAAAAGKVYVVTPLDYPDPWPTPTVPMDTLVRFEEYTPSTEYYIHMRN